MVDIYEHIMDDFNKRPREIAKHLREEHGIEPKPAMRGYEREVWHGQHDRAHYEGVSGFQRARSSHPVRG